MTLLEQILHDRAEDGDDDATTLWSLYDATDKILQPFHTWVSTKYGNYTDHGRLHVEAVKYAAGKLLLNPQGLSSLEIYLLLTAVIWHDIGMISGRAGHEKEVSDIISKVGDGLLSDPGYRRIVEEIIKAHSGKSGLEGPRWDEKLPTPSGGVQSVFPRALAAIVRFADEISENRSRINQVGRADVANDHRIYWEYANCIPVSDPEPNRERVMIKIEIDSDLIAERFICDDRHAQNAIADDGTISLIEYIICRLQKMNNERAYCKARFDRFSAIQEITARITIIKDHHRLPAYDDVSFSFGDSGLLAGSGYPDIKIFTEFFSSNPEWMPENLEKALT